MASVRGWLRRLGRRSLFLTVAGIARAGGFRAAPVFGKLLGELEYRIAWRRRRRCIRDMARALGKAPDDPWVAAQLRRAHHMNAQIAIEIVTLLTRKHDVRTLAPRLNLAGIEHLGTALAAGRGAILLGSHAGNGALMLVGLAAAGLPVSVVYRQNRVMPREFYADGFALYGIETILANEGLRAYGRMRDALQHGRIVFVTLDQGMKRAKGGVTVRFLGKDMGMAAGPAQLARHTGAPILPVMVTGYDGVWHFRIEPPLAPPSGPLEVDVARLAVAAERQVLLHPELWSWHHRRWHRQPFPHATMSA